MEGAQSPPDQPLPLVRSRVPLSCFGRREPVTQVLNASLHKEADAFPSSPRVDELPASYVPTDWTATEWRHFREVQAEMWEERRRVPTTGYEHAFGELLKKPMVGEPPEAAIQKKIDDTDREREKAFNCFKVLPREGLANQRQAKPHLDALADTIATQLKRSRSEVRKRLSGYLKEFLSS